ncbi:MAG: hypothetical protein RLZ10_2129 [Bacteroidota bacterium]|jgi:DNA topoisomerase-1
METTEKELKQRWDSKRDSIYNLKNNITRLKNQIRKDLKSDDEKEALTALIIRIMILTSERIGNDSSASNGRFGISQLKNNHIFLKNNKVYLFYTGKSGVKHSKSFQDETIYKAIRKLKFRNKDYLFVCKDGFRIKPDRINRYLHNFGAKSKDIRGFNANHLMLLELNRIGKVEDKKDRVKIFNVALRKIAEKIGHLPGTLRKHYLLPEIEDSFYSKGSVSRIKLD